MQPTVHQIISLRQSIFWLCSIIFLITLVITIFLIIEHRRGSEPKKAHFHKSVYIEIMWAVIPFLIIFSLAYPTVFKLLAVNHPEFTSAEHKYD
jgi:hypothetical protein